jgi:hypothetical protein
MLSVWVAEPGWTQPPGGIVAPGLADGPARDGVALDPGREMRPRVA